MNKIIATRTTMFYWDIINNVTLPAHMRIPIRFTQNVLSNLPS